MPLCTETVEAKTEANKKTFLTCLKQQYGVITKACEVMGIPRSTYYLWAKKDPEFLEEVRSIDEYAVDCVVHKSYEKMLKGDGDTSLIIFFLKTKARHRGYAEIRELEIGETAMQKIQDALKEQAVKYEKEY